MQIYEKLLKAMIGKKITVKYGRCSGPYDKGVIPCEESGTLRAVDNLCIVLELYNKDYVIINKSKIESIYIERAKIDFDSFYKKNKK